MNARVCLTPILFIAFACVGCATEGYEAFPEDDSFRDADICDSQLFDLVWIDTPTFAVAAGDPVTLRGEVTYDAAGLLDCDMSNWRVTFEPQPALSLADGVEELNGVWSPGTTIPFELRVKATKEALAGVPNAANFIIVGCLAEPCDAHPQLPPSPELWVIPDGEVSEKDGFNDGYVRFGGSLRPKPAGFLNREVIERQLQMPVGDCDWTGLTGLSDHVRGAVDGSKDVYGPDVIGFSAFRVAALRQFRLNGQGCSTTVQQTMAMEGPDGVYFDYETHPVTIAVDRDCQGGLALGKIAVTRDGECLAADFDPDQMPRDGVVDSESTIDDKDHDGIDDIFEGIDGDPAPTAGDRDTDSDDIPDFLDWDDDADTIETLLEINKHGGRHDDVDGDGVPNRLDADDDGDGDDTSAEDVDGNGQPGNDDSDGDGVPDAYESSTADLDGDGTVDDADLDNDGDGISNLAEDRTINGNPMSTDTDGDGLRDYRDTDDDGDGIPTAGEDTNHNGNWLDDDSDGDSIPDYLDP